MLCRAAKRGSRWGSVPPNVAQLHVLSVSRHTLGRHTLAQECKPSPVLHDDHLGCLSLAWHADTAHAWWPPTKCGTQYTHGHAHRAAAHADVRAVMHIVPAGCELPRTERP